MSHQTINWNLVLFQGILFAILGTLAIAMPGIATLSIELIIGWLFIIAGVVQVAKLFAVKGGTNLFVTLVSAIAYLIIGILMISYPLGGVLTLTLLLTIFFIVEGIAQVIVGFDLKPMKGWGWILFSGIISLVLAYLIFSNWPGAAAWIIGLLVGVNLLFIGISQIIISIEGRRLAK